MSNDNEQAALRVLNRFVDELCSGYSDYRVLTVRNFRRACAAIAKPQKPPAVKGDNTEGKT
jgi:hypothetical protein